MGHYCAYHVNQGIREHSNIAFKGQVLVEPFKGDRCMHYACKRNAIWLTSCYPVEEKGRKQFAFVGAPQ